MKRIIKIIVFLSVWFFMSGALYPLLYSLNIVKMP